MKKLRPALLWDLLVHEQHSTRTLQQNTGVGMMEWLGVLLKNTTRVCQKTADPESRVVYINKQKHDWSNSMKAWKRSKVLPVADKIISFHIFQIELILKDYHQMSGCNTHHRPSLMTVATPNRSSLSAHQIAIASPTSFPSFCGSCVCVSQEEKQRGFVFSCLKRHPKSSHNFWVKTLFYLWHKSSGAKTGDKRW